MTDADLLEEIANFLEDVCDGRNVNSAPPGRLRSYVRDLREIAEYISTWAPSGEE